MKKSLLILFIFALSACAQMGLSSPQSLDQKLGATLATVQVIETNAAAALTAKAITKADAQEIYELSTQIRNVVVSAHALEQSDPTTATGKYNLAIGVLTQLQAYTAARGIK